MKAIILAAGQGTRLLPLTADRPKCLVNLKGKTLLEWQIVALRRVGINDILVVAGYRSEMIAFSGVRVKVNPEYASTNMVRTLFSVEEELVGDVLVCYGDIVYGQEVLTSVMTSVGDILIAVDVDWLNLWQNRMDDPLADAESMRLGENNEILELGKKVKSVNEIEGQFVGLICFHSNIINQVRRIYHGLDRTRTYDNKTFDDMFMTSFLTELREKGLKLTAAKIHGGWCEVDTVGDLAVYQHMPLAFLKEYV